MFSDKTAVLWCQVEFNGTVVGLEVRLCMMSLAQSQINPFVQSHVIYLYTTAVS